MVRIVTVSAAGIILVSASLLSAGQNAPPLPAPKDKCPVCGMFVAKYPDWTAAVVLGDGSRLYFDGPKDLFAFLLNPGKYGRGGVRGETAAVFVRDYYSLAFIDGRRAFYVTGSDVRGPMGKELVPFARKADADGFLKDHGGKQVLRFGDVTPARLKQLE